MALYPTPHCAISHYIKQEERCALFIETLFRHEGITQCTNVHIPVWHHLQVRDVSTAENRRLPLWGWFCANTLNPT